MVVVWIEESTQVRVRIPYGPDQRRGHRDRSDSSHQLQHPLGLPSKCVRARNEHSELGGRGLRFRTYHGDYTSRNDVRDVPLLLT